MRGLSRALAAIAVVAMATGCSASVGSAPSVDHVKLGKVVSKRLTEQVGQRPDKVTCPKDLKGKKGATTRCTLTSDGTRYGVTVTTTSVKDKDVKFHIEVDDQPQA